MRITVDISDMRISNSVGDVLVTYALGSCLGVAIYDPVAEVGGLLHVLLPDSSIDPDKARLKPCMFVDTGVPYLFREAYKVGAQKERIVVKAAGCASMRSEEDDRFQIGKRNELMLRKLLWKNGVMLEGCDLGGKLARTMSLDIGTGAVLLRTRDGERSV